MLALSLSIYGELKASTYGAGLKSWKKSRSVLPAFFISKEIAWPAGQEKVEITKELPGEMVISPRSSATEGALLKFVWLVATLASFATSILPSPLKLKEEV
jgi:hypothetical protein